MTSLTHAREIYEDGRTEGLAAGKIQSILDVLGELGDVPETLREKISREGNLETLGGWVKLAARAESAADFEEKMWNI